MKRNGLFTSHYSLLTHKCAFTLAEVLITLGIIGIVAALTIPSLITNYKANKLRAQFLKSYSTVQQVFKQMEADGVSLTQLIILTMQVIIRHLQIIWLGYRLWGLWGFLF